MNKESASDAELADRAETEVKNPVSSTNITVRGFSIVNKGSESDTDPPERAIEESLSLEDVASARRGTSHQCKGTHSNGTEEQVQCSNSARGEFKSGARGKPPLHRDATRRLWKSTIIPTSM
jgi:hypothetical protein